MPISPKDIAVANYHIPAQVFDAFDKLIIENYNSGTAIIYQSQIVDVLVTMGYGRAEIFSRGYLDIEHVYGDLGWHVTYDKPGYNESYEASFTFKARNITRKREL